MTVVAVVVHCSDCFTERRVPAAGVQQARARLRDRMWERRSINGVVVDLCPRCIAVRYGEKAS